MSPDPLRASARAKPQDWLLVAGVALAARLAYLATVAGQPLRSDAFQYHELAANLAGGNGFSSQFPQVEVHATAWRPPGYPFLLSTVYRVAGGSEGVGRAVNVLLGVGVAVLAAYVAYRIAGRWAALAAGLAAGLYPPLIANDVTTLSEPFALLLGLTLVLLLRDQRFLLAGLVGGLLLLSRPSAPLLILAVAVAVLVVAGWRRSLAFAGIALLVAAPWVIRNWVQVDAPTLVTSTGFNLVAVYSPEAVDSEEFVDATTDVRLDQFRLSQFDEAAWDGELRSYALSNIAENPALVPKNLLQNVMQFFEIDTTGSDIAEYSDGRNLDLRTWTLPLFFVVTAGGLVGLVIYRRISLVRWLAFATAISSFSVLIFMAPPRLRAPFDLAMCIGVGLLVAAIAERVRGAGRRRAPDSVISLGDSPDAAMRQEQTAQKSRSSFDSIPRSSS